MGIMRTDVEIWIYGMEQKCVAVRKHEQYGQLAFITNAKASWNV